MSMNPPPPWPPYQPYPQQPPNGGNGGTIVGMAILGTLLFVVANAIFGFALVILSDGASSRSENWVLAAGAALSAGVAFGGGILMARNKSAVVRGLGIGLMIGWALVTVCTVGFCTGINPDLYK